MWPREQTLPVGSEAPGVVTAVGDAANGAVQVGDEVIVFPVAGAHASILLVPLDAVVPKPERLSLPRRPTCCS